MKKSVYLAGPIGGYTDQQIRVWRQTARELMPGFRVIDPTRDSDGLYEPGQLVGQNGRPPHMQVGPILRRCFYDVHHADIVLANLSYATQPSQGTMMEMAWAYAEHKPIVLVPPTLMQEHRALHALMAPMSTYVCVSLEEACDHIQSYLYHD